MKLIQRLRIWLLCRRIRRMGKRLAQGMDSLAEESNRFGQALDCATRRWEQWIEEKRK
jgi:hypothetical protein